MTDDLRKNSSILDLIGMLEYELEAIDQTLPFPADMAVLNYISEARATLTALRERVGGVESPRRKK